MRLRDWRVCADAHAQRSFAHEQSPPCFRCFWARRTACARCPSGTGAGSGRIRHRLRAGEQVSLGRPVAVKIDSRPLHDERNRRRFMREMAAASRISGHPNAVSLIDSGVLPDGRPYLVMERCDGGSLAQVLQRGELSAAQAVSIISAVCSALGAAHDAGVLHRDIKPGNILIDAYGSPRLRDFGLAAVQHEGIDSSVTLETMTPNFAPPEAFTLAAPSPRGDVWSMGAVLFALLTGRGPRRTADGAPPEPAGDHQPPVGAHRHLRRAHPRGVTSVARPGAAPRPRSAVPRRQRADRSTDSGRRALERRVQHPSLGATGFPPPACGDLDAHSRIAPLEQGTDAPGPGG